MQPRLPSWAIFILLLLTYGYFFQSGQHNENVRLDLTRALYETKSVKIDRFVFNTADAIVVNGHAYSGKAPGLSLFVVPHWALFRLVTGWLITDPQRAEHFAVYLTILFSISIASALFGAGLFTALRAMLTSESLALLITLGYALGTIAFPFSTLFFSHQCTAVLIGTAFILIAKGSARVAIPELPSWLAGGPARASCVAGLLCGLAVTTEYPLALAGPPIALYAWYACRSFRAFVGFGAGGLIGIGVLLVYNQHAFGNPLFLTYSVYATDANRTFTGHDQGFLGIALPSLRVLWRVTFHSQRGLFFCNPWLILLIPAVLFVPFQERRYRAEAIVSATLVLMYFLFNASFTEGIVYSGGGASVGPRHIMPMLPFAAVLVGLLASRHKWVSAGLLPLVLVSVSIMLMATASEPRVPYEYENPVRDLFWESYLRGSFNMGRAGVFSETFVTARTISFNLGKLFALPGAYELIPLLAIWALFLALAIHRLKIGLETAFCCGMWLAILAGLPPYRHFAERSTCSSPQGLSGIYRRGTVSTTCAPVLVLPSFLGADVVFRRIDRSLVFDWSAHPLMPAPYVVEWRGTLEVPETAQYTLATKSDDGACLYLDGRLAVDNDGRHLPERAAARRDLEAGSHKLNIIMWNPIGGGHFELLWSRPGVPEEPIGSEFLRPEQ